MKRLLTVVFVLALSTYAFAEDAVKIGFVDMQAAANESEAGKAAKKELEKMIKDKQQKTDEKMAVRDKLVAEIEKQSVVLSDEARRQKQDELDKLTREIDRMVSDFNAELQKQQRELEIGIAKELDAIITEIGKEGKYTIIVLDDVVLYSAEGVDITDLVIQRHNERHKAKAKAGASK